MRDLQSNVGDRDRTDNRKTVESPSGTVGTLTFHEALNYGAALQAFALQRAIINLGYQSEVINYSCEAIRKAYEAPNSFKAKIGWLLRERARSQRARKFSNFFAVRINVSEPVDRAGFNRAAEGYRAIVVGSDQVWNPQLTDGDMTYFLDCVDDSSKKKAYAASLGVKSWPSSTEMAYADALRDFSTVTVREETAAKYLGELLEEQPMTVCDPTMLLTEDEWSSVAAARLVTDPYVLMYCFGNPEPDCLSWAKQKAKRMNCKLVVINLAAFPIPGVINMRAAGPEEFLSLIRHAQLVVTHSFHGICFSIIFRRDFCWFKSSGVAKQLERRSSRIVDLLARLGLSGRVVSTESELPPSIDYAPVACKISDLREDSLTILRSML